MRFAQEDRREGNEFDEGSNSKRKQKLGCVPEIVISGSSPFYAFSRRFIE